MKASLHACHCSEESENREVIIGCDKEVCASVKDEKYEIHNSTFLATTSGIKRLTESDIAGMKNTKYT